VRFDRRIHWVVRHRLPWRRQNCLTRFPFRSRLVHNHSAPIARIAGRVPTLRTGSKEVSGAHHEAPRRRVDA
jgi:hypothetical protein